MVILFVLASYLIGAIPFGLIISKMFQGIDIREHGSGNIGATNVMRKMGTRFALFVLFLDMAKGALVVCIATQLNLETPVMLLVSLTVIIGHCFPVFLKFKGGKGVATTLGVLLFIPGFALPMLFVLAVFIVIVALTRYVSLGSVVAVLIVPVSFIILSIYNPENFSYYHVIFGIALAALLIFCHRDNIARLLSGRESKIGEKKNDDSSNR